MNQLRVWLAFKLRRLDVPILVTIILVGSPFAFFGDRLRLPHGPGWMIVAAFSVWMVLRLWAESYIEAIKRFPTLPELIDQHAECIEAELEINGLAGRIGRELWRWFA